MDESDFFFGPSAALNEHLQEVRPIFDAFCAEHGFAYVDWRAVGRYPRIRIERPGSVTIWFDLWMEFDWKGRRFEVFRSDLPYELSAGAHFHLPEESEFGIRFQKAMACFSRIPFEQVPHILKGEMEKYLPVLETWDRSHLIKHGKKIMLGA
jgi:hypothetical protein